MSLNILNEKEKKEPFFSLTIEILIHTFLFLNKPDGSRFGSKIHHKMINTIFQA